MRADLAIFGASMVGAVAAADCGERLTMAALLVCAFWTVVRMVREIPR